MPDGFVQLVNVRPLPNGITVAAARTNNSNQSPVISKPHDASSFEQKWARKSISGFVSYEVPFGDKRITYKPGDPTAPFRQQTATEGQLFKGKVVGCL